MTVVIKDVWKTFGGAKALSGVDLDVGAGRSACAPRAERRW